MERTIEDRIQDRYLLRRRKIHPGYLPKYETNANAWVKTAQLVSEIGADPELFVDSLFESGHKWKGGFPWPNQLFSSFARQIYEDSKESMASSPEARVDVQMRLLASNTSSESPDEIDEALSNPELPFKSWFRILMCSDKNLELFSRVWGSFAERQVHSDKTLRDIIKSKYGFRSHRFFK